jgi:hypothetical protein
MQVKRKPQSTRLFAYGIEIKTKEMIDGMLFHEAVLCGTHTCRVLGRRFSYTRYISTAVSIISGGTRWLHGPDILTYLIHPHDKLPAVNSWMYGMQVDGTRVGL